MDDELHSRAVSSRMLFAIKACFPPDSHLFKSSAFLGTEDGVRDAHVHQRVFKTVGQGDRAAHRSRKRFALKRVLVAWGKDLCVGALAIHCRPVVDGDPCGFTLRGVERDMDLDPSARSADLHALIRDTLS